MNIFEPEIIRNLFKNNYLLFVFGVFIGVFLFTYYIIPKVLWVIKEKRLFKPVVGRSVHITDTPSFGGVAFFIAFVLAISMLQSFYDQPTGDHLIAAVTILFMVGLKDDLVVSTPKAKFLGQIVATAFIVFSPQMQITTLHGFLGIHEIPVALGYVISAFMVVAMINAYNFIDGINGLAGIIGIIICGTFGFAFYQAGNPDFAMICVTIMGMLAAFLRYNFSRGGNKIFMGDSGSLIIGLILGVLSVKILAITGSIPHLEVGVAQSHRIWFISAVLFVPVFDMIRVMILRLWKGSSPFEAGRNHAHHVLLDLGLSHLQASIFLGIVNLFVIAVFLLLNKVVIAPWLGVYMILVYVMFFLLFEGAVKYLVGQKVPSTTKKERKKRNQYKSRSSTMKQQFTQNQ